MRFFLTRRIGCALLVLLFAPTHVLAELAPNQLALVVNKNVPAGVELAKFYALARSVPADRVIELDLADGDEISFDDYDRLVAKPLREFIEAKGLRQNVKCLVTFHGVPLRVAKRTVSPQEQAELERMRAEHRRVQQRIGEGIGALERLARFHDASYQPPPATGAPDALAKRADHATRVVKAAVEKLTDPKSRQSAEQSLDQINRFLSAPIGDVPATGPASGPATAPAAPASEPGADADPSQLQQLIQRPDDPAARAGVRAIARRTANLFAYERVLQEQAGIVDPEHTDSALDSELSLLWIDRYPRRGWQPNPLGYPYLKNPSPPQVVMVMRLDGPLPDVVRRMIETSIDVERTGLTGKFVVDSRGIAPRQPGGAPDGFGLFDQRLRELATIVKAHAKVELVHDEKPDVLPAEPKVQDVALYCGWYSVGKYVPSMRLAPGAVGYHVASYELTSLRDPTNTGWGRGLLADGAAATLGPVSEPLLHAFPGPDDFFPLLMTGRLTLAEVYWRTCPLVSWKMVAVGDPLYTPFKSKPLMRVEDLPERLKPLFAGAP